MIHWPLGCFHAAWRTLWKEWDWLVEDSSIIPCISKLPPYGGRHAACAISARSPAPSGRNEAALKESRGGRTGRSRGVESSKKQRNFQGRKGELAGSNRVSSSPWSHAIAAINETERVGRERQTDTTRLRRNEARFCVNTEIDWHFVHDLSPIEASVLKSARRDWDTEDGVPSKFLCNW
jgi:hypothetical protein